MSLSAGFSSGSPLTGRLGIRWAIKGPYRSPIVTTKDHSRLQLTKVEAEFIAKELDNEGNVHEGRGFLLKVVMND